MFGFLKPKPAPEGPVGLAGEVMIEKPAAEVYALLDWADPLNAQRQRGSIVTAVEGQPDLFEMTIPALAGHRFNICVTEAVPNETYEFTTDIEPRVGRLAASQELYTIEPLTADSCRLRLLNTVLFIDGLRMKEFEAEVGTMTIATHNALAKLKILAEQGVEAVQAQDSKLIV